MIKYILRRILSMFPLLLGISMLVFVLMYIAPGDFLTQARNSKDISPEIVRQQEISLGLDRPWFVQYGMWLNNVSPIKTSLLLPAPENKTRPLIFFGAPDFGYSWAYKIPVSQLLGQRVTATLILSLVSLLITYAVAIPLGVLAAMKKDSVFDKLSAFLAYAALSIPSFFLALLAVLFAALTGILPTGGMSSITYDFLSPAEQFADRIAHLILPALVLSVGGIASVMRIMRGNFLDYSRAEFVTTARAKGLSENVVMFKHVLRNALNPIITSFGFAFSGLLSGALLIENVMNYPGLGQLVYDAIMNQDQYVVMAGVVIGCVMLVTGQLLADILLAACDPRIRLENERLPKKAIGFVLASLLALAVFFTWLAESDPTAFAAFKTAALWLIYALVGILCALLIVALCVAFVYFVKNFLFKILRVPRGAIAFLILCLFYFGAIFAGFLAPYDRTTASLEKPFHPPTRVFFEDGGLRVQVYENQDPSISGYVPIDGKSLPLKFFPKKDNAYILGVIPINHALFGVDSDDPNARVYLMGSDSTGRDVFSRLLYGAQVSLSIGFAGIAITMVIGFLVGGLSGYFGGTFDFIAMRFVEFLMAIPGLYLLLAMRSALAGYFDSSQMYFVIIIILAMLGWAGTARVIRGMSLSLAKRQFVQASQAMGQSAFKIIIKHFLPNVMGFLIVAATLSIPGYILGEAALSFLGLGIQEPDSSWGLMLSYVQKDTKILMLGFWWMLLPGLAIFMTVLAFNILGDALRDLADHKK